MKSKLATTALLIGALTMPIMGLAAEDKDQDRSSPKAWVKDSVITTKIKAEMVKDPTVRATSIKVDTDANGVVQLSGTAKSQAEIDKAMQIAQSTKGVSTVQNKITLAK